MYRRTFLESCVLASWKNGPPKDFLGELPTWMSVAPVPAVWITWLDRGKVAWEQGVGVRNAGPKQPVDSQTMFEAASLTKQVTAHVAHALHTKGTLDFDKPSAATSTASPIPLPKPSLRVACSA